MTGLGFDEAHALGRLVGLPFKRRNTALVSDPQQVKGRAIVVSRQILELMRRSADLIVLLEDVHWADPASWDYLLETSLLSPAGEHGLMVLSTARPDCSPPEALLNHSSYKEISTQFPARCSNLPAHQRAARSMFKTCRMT